MRKLLGERGSAVGWATRNGVVLALAVLLGACSGRVETVGSDAGAGAGETANPTASDSGKEDGLPRQALGPCSPGFLRTAFPGRACNWLSESGQCFDSTDQACNCICPPQGKSICSHTGDASDGNASPIYCDKI